MASPQIEDGYTRIANELLESLARIRIPGEAMQILSVILRKTYGFGKKQDVISLSQFNLATGIVKPSIVRALKILGSMNLISKKANGKDTTYSINKDYSTWKPLAKKLTLAKKLINVSEKANNRLRKSYPQYIKEKRKGGVALKPPSSNGKDSRVKPLIDHFFLLCKEKLDQKPDIEGNKDGSAIKRALQKFDEEQIKNLFDFYVNSPKAHNILIRSLSSCSKKST